MACGGTTESYNGEFQQLFLHHPLEIVVEIAIDCKNVVCPLVVGHKNI